MSTLQNSINANASTPLSTTQGGSGVSAPTAHGILVAEGASAFATKVLTNGELLIGSTGSDPVGATITAGAGISITNGAGSISIASSSVGGYIWNNTTGTSATLAAGNAYIADNAALVTFTLPATAVIGDTFLVVGGAAGVSGWTIAQNAGQSINFGNTVTTTGTGGSISSTNQYDKITVTCIVANTGFVAYDAQGELTVA